MVGKSIVESKAKTSRIFHQCYLKCCKLQNLTPLNNVLPGGNGKVLDFCVDRIKYADWPPILNALSCDLSLHSVSIKCRQPVKTVLEHIDCERLAKTVNNRSVILTNFMLTNLIEATSQLLSNTTLLTSLTLEGLPLRIPYLNPMCEAILTNSSLRHLFLSRCLIGDAGCMSICKAVRCLPNILTLDLSGCDLTPSGAGYIADLVKYQKIHRYSENWVHTLRYRLPDLDTMAGLRRISLCGNPMLTDSGLVKLLDVLADDLWIKALDIQNCSLTEVSALAALQTMNFNKTLVILDMRHNVDIPGEALTKVRAALKENENGLGGQFSWLANTIGSSSESKSLKSSFTKSGAVKDRLVSNSRTTSNKYATKTNLVKKEKDYTEALEEQLQEEISHRQQLEELNLQLVNQMKLLKQQHLQLWANGGNSSSSEQSFQASSRSEGLSSSSGSSSSVPIDQNTLSYIQQAFKDIYAFIKNNQCHGQCFHQETEQMQPDHQPIEAIKEANEIEEYEASELRINIVPKKAQSTHMKLLDSVKMNKTTKSAHLLGDLQLRDSVDVKPGMFEKQIGDTKNAHGDELTVEDFIAAQCKPRKNSIYEKSSASSSVVSDSSETLVCTPGHEDDDTQRTLHPAPALSLSPSASPTPTSSLAINPREALYSTDDDDSS